MLHSFVMLDIIQFSSLFYDNVTATRCSRLANIDMIKNSGKGTPSWWGWKISCKGIFFLPHLNELLHLSRVPHLQVLTGPYSQLC